jgi:hypothetical protein
LVETSESIGDGGESLRVFGLTNMEASMSVAYEPVPDALPRTEQFRFVSLTEDDGKSTLALRAFFRRIGLSRVYDEMVAPGLQDGSGLVVMAVRDRPWPPFGIGAQSVSAMCFIYPIGEGRAGLANVFALPEEQLSIGLLAAVYREALDILVERGTKWVHFVTRDDSHFAAHVLQSAGFEQTGIPYITEAARYCFHEVEIAAHLGALGITDTTPLQLLADEFPESTLERTGLYLLTVNTAFSGFWSETVKAPELIPNMAIARVAASAPPGGPPIKRGPVRKPATRPR